jgi:signal transduction histidine kinase/CheY-like chemotaxis protein
MQKVLENKTHKALERHEKMLEATNRAAIILLTRQEEDFEGAMSEGIGIIAGLADIDRMSVFRSIEKPDGLHVSQLYRWTKESSGTTDVIPELADIACTSFLPAGWEKTLAWGECTSGLVSCMPEATMLRRLGCVTVLAVPVVNDGRFWGFAFFEKLTEEKFSAYETEVLRSVSFMLANAVMRNKEAELMRNEIENQNRLLRVVNEVSVIMLQTDEHNFESDILRSMKMLAHAVDADRVYIWKNSIRNGDLYCSQIYEWSEGAEPQQGKDFAVETLYSEATPEWAEAFSQGRCVNGIVRELSENEQAGLSPQGILSVLAVPIFLKDEFWGFIGFDDCHRERVFTRNEEILLRSTSELIANSLVRHDMEKNLRTSAVRLQRALDDARAASLAKGEFLSHMSHEMRTPMNAIIGMTGIAMGTASTEKKDYCLEKIDGASKHLLGVINDVLDMSKIEANKFVLAPHSFGFENLIHSVSNVLNFRIEEKNLEFIVNLDERLPPHVIGDELRITQVITNLLTNAVKFTPDGGTVKLNVQCLKSRGKNITILFEVIDTGIGVSAEQQSRLFTAFEQAESGTARKYGGTGLGLAIAKHIVEMMGGSIWVESEPGHGAKFAFTISLEQGEEKKTDAVSNPFFTDTLSDTLPGVAPRYPGRSILIAEDVEINREIIANVLGGTGIALDFAQNGLEVLRQFEKAPEKYNIILMDVQMPEMDGYTATRKIRALNVSRAKSVPIIAMTANVFKEDVEACLAAGMNGHLGKPIDVAALFEKIGLYL